MADGRNRINANKNSENFIGGRWEGPGLSTMNTSCCTTVPVSGILYEYRLRGACCGQLETCVGMIETSRPSVTQSSHRASGLHLATSMLYFVLVCAMHTYLGRVCIHTPIDYVQVVTADSCRQRQDPRSEQPKSNPQCCYPIPNAQCNSHILGMLR